MMNRIDRSFLRAAILALPLLVSAPARATLTDAEKQQVISFIVDGSPDRASRVRSLVARPDLTAEEVAEPVVAALERVEFDDAHQRFLEALLFGPASAAARSTVTPAVVQGLLARADRQIGGIPAGRTERWKRAALAAVGEVTRIHRFVAQHIANGGAPMFEGHDPARGIRDDAFQASAEHYRRHFQRNRQWLVLRQNPDARVQRMRLQATLAFLDLGSGVVPPHELGDWIALTEGQRTALERYGLLIDFDRNVPSGRVDEALRLLERLRARPRALRLWMLGKLPITALATRGEMIAARAVFDAGAVQAPADRFWPEDVTPSRPDQASAELALSIALSVARAVLERAPALREVAHAAAERAERAGPGAYLARDLVASTLYPAPGANVGVPGLSAEELLGYTIRLLLIDGPRALEMALIRASHGSTEPLEQFALALGVLSGGQEQVALGQVTESGEIAAAEAQRVELDGHRAVAFTIEGRRYTLAGSGDTLAVSVGGQPLKLSELRAFRLRTVAAESWSAFGQAFQRLHGAPEAANVDDGRFVLVGKSGGFDAAVTGPEASSVDVYAKLRPLGSGGGVLARARPGPGSYAGVALLISAEPAQARLVVLDGKGGAVQLGKEVRLSAAPKQGYAVHLRIRGTHITASVDSARLEGTLKESGTGRVGITARAGGRIDLWEFKSSASK